MIARNTGDFCEEYYPNVFDIFLIKVAYGSETVGVEIWDTSGTESEFATHPEVYRAVNVYLLCFALHNIASYHNVKNKWFPEIQRIAPNVPIVLIGCQSDLRYPGSTSAKHVTQQMGEQLKTGIKSCAYIECSACDDIGVNEVFEAVVRIALPTPPLARSSEVLTSQPGSIHVFANR